MRQYPQRALTVARQVLTDNPEFRARVASAATVDNVGEQALQWLHGQGPWPEDQDEQSEQEPTASGDESESDESSDIDHDAPVTKETIRSEMDELKNLVWDALEHGEIKEPEAGETVTFYANVH